MDQINKVDYNIEYAHIYSSDIGDDLMKIRNNIFKVKNLIKTINNLNATYSLTVLVDDYSENQLPVSKELINNLFFELGLVPDHIIMESEMSNEADFLLNTLPEKYLIKEENRFILRSESSDIHFAEMFQEKKRYKTIEMEKMLLGEKAWNDLQKKNFLNLKQQRLHSNSNLVLVFDDGKTRKYSCPLLAACWYLARLGIDPFYSSIKHSLNLQKVFVGENLLTVLNLNYLKVESTAIELIGLSKSKTISKCKRRIEYYFTS